MGRMKWTTDLRSGLPTGSRGAMKNWEILWAGRPMTKRTVGSLRRVLTAGAILILVGLGSGDLLAAPPPACPTFQTPTETVPFVSLADLLRYPPEPVSRLERAPITTEGYVARATRLYLPATRCQSPAAVYRLWLTATRPHGLKGAIPRHRAVVITVPASIFKQAFGANVAPVNKRRPLVRVTGYPVYEPRERHSANVSRGTPWELRAVTELTVTPRHDTQPH